MSKAPDAHEQENADTHHRRPRTENGEGMLLVVVGLLEGRVY